jgi:hypothetical protein
METLKLKVQHSEKPVICSLVLDEMAIRKHVEWDGTKYHGTVDFGSVLDDPALGEATQALDFMAVSIESWKIPVGYFFIHSITSTQKAELVKLCLTMLFECGVKVTNLTVDGASVNSAIAQLLASSLDAYNMNPEIIWNSISVYIVTCTLRLASEATREVA